MKDKLLVLLFLIFLFWCSCLISIGAGELVFKLGIKDQAINMGISVVVGAISLLGLMVTSRVREFVVKSLEPPPAAESEEKDEPVRKFKR